MENFIALAYSPVCVKYKHVCLQNDCVGVVTPKNVVQY